MWSGSRSYASRRRLSFASTATVHVAGGKAQHSRFRHATYETGRRADVTLR